MKAILFLVLAAWAGAREAVDLQPLAIGLQQRAVERLLGEPHFSQRHREAATYESTAYHLRFDDKRGGRAVLTVYFNRDFRVREVRVRYVNEANGGKDPRTGLPWAPPAEFASYALRAVGQAGDWQREGGGVFSNRAAGARARWVGGEMIIAGR